ncbi:hypothetical protein PG985_012238 [Apiospora marii]|uniref:uncharacterized protein n=1 Tax=Apiospora marii TaxID=335849 RepID=UPI00312DE846
MEKFESVFAVSTANITQDYHDARSWSPTALWTGSALSFILFLSAYLIVNKAVHYPVPKGPRSLPILVPTLSAINPPRAGSFPFLTHYPKLTLSRWAQKFGPLYSIWLGNQHVVVISSAEVAKDLLVANGSIFLSRKEMYIKSQHILAGRGITTTPYNDTWRKHRRITNAWLQQKAVSKFTAVFDREANDMPFAGRCSLNNMLTIVFGIRTASVDDPLVATALRLSREFMNCTGPMSNIIDFLPVLRIFPSEMRSRAIKLHRDLVETYGGIIQDIDKRRKRGEKVPDCLATTLLQMKEAEKLDDLDLSMMAAAFMIGGVETAASITQWFSALIPSYPEIQRRAQEELDTVVGRDRLPGIEDEKHLPYCRALIKEVERCYNPFWLSTPHYTTEEFVYKGQRIPKETMVVLNTWSIHHDEKRYPDPDTFNPDRYLHDTLTSAQSANLSDASQRDHWVFGAGRRICPAISVAERETWLAISRILWAFDMETETPGVPIDLKEYDGLSGRSPLPFRIRMKPRHENVELVLKAAVKPQ